MPSWRTPSAFALRSRQVRETRDPSYLKRKHTRQHGKPPIAVLAFQDSYLLFRDIAANQDGTGEDTALSSESIIIPMFG